MEETGTQRSHGMGKGAMGIGMMGRRQVTPKWENDTVWLHGGVDGRVARGGYRHLPQTENRRRVEKGGAG